METITNVIRWFVMIVGGIFLTGGVLLVADKPVLGLVVFGIGVIMVVTWSIIDYVIYLALEEES